MKSLISISSTLSIVLSIVLSIAVSASNIAHANDRPQRGPDRPAFADLDADQDEVLTLEEFSAHESPRHDPADIFAEIDKDGDELITLEEFNSHKPQRPRGERPSRD